MRPLSILSLVAALGFSTASHASAATYDWNNTGSGTFSNGANWTPVGGPPGPADTARFALGSGVNSNVTFSGHANIAAYTQNSGNVTFFLNGFTLQASAVNFSGMGADNATASLRILNGNFQPAGFTVGGNTGSNASLTLDANAIMTVNSGVFQVGNNGTGALIIQNGAQLTTNADTRLATNVNGAGTATVNGAGSSWNIPNNTLRIGVNNDAAVNVLNGATVTANALEVGEGLNANGTLNLSGAGATFTTNGNANIGGLSANAPAESATLAVGPGATVNLNGTTNFRTTSTLHVTGGTLNLNNANLAAGADANWTAGTVSFANGSALTPAMLDYLLDGTHVLGTNRTLAATAGIANLTTPLAVNGGTLSANQILIGAGLSIGAFGTVNATDTLEIGPGQTVEVENFGTLAAGTLSHNNGGTLILKGPNAQVSGFFANNFGVIEGTGRFTGGMNMGTGGTIRAKTGDHIIIDTTGLTNPGIIELAGGTVEYKGVLSNLGNGVITGRGTFRAGTLNPGGNGVSNLGVMAFSGGPTDIFGDVNNPSTGRIVAAGGSVVTFYDDVTHNGAEIQTTAGSRTVFYGNVTGAGPFTGGGVNEFVGDLKPGNSPANIPFGGDVEFGPAADLFIELAGTTKGAEYDSLSILGAATLNGVLNVSLLGGFVPALGDQFEIMTADDGIDGDFNKLILPDLPGLLDWSLTNKGKSLILAVSAPPLPGDFNQDAKVDSLDLNVWNSAFTMNHLADADGDSDSDGNDFLIWQQNLGLTAAMLPAANQVPEPAAWSILALSLTALPVRRRRQ